MAELLKFVNSLETRTCKYGCLYRKDGEKDAYICCHYCDRRGICDAICSVSKKSISDKECDWTIQ